MNDIAIFTFQNMMATVMNGMAGKMIPALQTVSYMLMTACLLLAIYEAFAKGGDTRQLVAAVFKYIVVAFIVANWGRFFGDTISGFNAIAQYIDNSYGAGDLTADWQQSLSDNWNGSGYNSIWNIITSGGAAVFNALEIALSYIIFPLAVQIFTVIYVFWGAVLFAVGPLVLALSPSQMVNSTAKFYARNLVVWNCWSIVYAVFACLITAVNGKDLTTSPFFAGSVVGGQAQIYIGLTSILYSICILLIPVIAFSVLRGEYGPVGGALMGLVSTAMMTTRTAAQVAKTVGAGGRSAGSAASTQGGTMSGTYARNYSVTPPNTPARMQSAT